MTVVPGYEYVVTTTSSCTVTDDATGTELVTAYAGQQAVFQAIGESITLSDPEAIVKVRRSPFESTPGGALSLAGGDSLPDGYIPCSFLEFYADSAFDTDVTVDEQTGVSFDCCRKEATTFSTLNVVAGNYSRDSSNNYVYATLVNKGLLGLSGSAGSYYMLKSGGWANSFAGVSAETGYKVYGVRTVIKMNWLNNNKFSLNYNGETSQRDMPYRFSASSLPLSIGNGATARPLVQAFYGSLYRFSVSQGSQKVREYIPALAVEGVPVLYDLVKKKALTNSTDTAPLPAFSLAQARQLGRLAAGATCKVLLPTGWQADNRVTEALNLAAQNGSEVTVWKEYAEPAAAAAVTYSLRRVRQVVWCRVAEEADGSYVSVNGERFNIEHCAAIFGPLGSDPTAYGYEPFDSVEQAAEEWDLQPYVYPEEAEPTID